MTTPEAPTDPAPECPHCKRKVLSRTAPRCMFCGAPLQEGAVAWAAVDQVQQAARDHDNERAKTVQIAVESDPTDKSLEGGSWLIPYTLSRSDYFLRLLACCFLPAVPAMLGAGSRNPAWLISSLFLLGVILIYKLAVLNTARARDCGRSAAFGLTPLIPGIGVFFQLYLFFASSR